MDKQIEALLLSFPTVSRRETKSLNSREKAKFNRVNYDEIAERLQSYHPGEVVTLESIDPESGKILFKDGIHGRKSLPLETLEYRLRDLQKELGECGGNEIYFPNNRGY